MFSNLLKLYKSSSKNTPTEDFTTEVLAGILSSDKLLLAEFVNIVLKIEGSNFKVKTQVYYEKSIIDMVFENKDTICFLENKVDSSEGHKQLEKYSKILLKNDKKPFLRYCTKFIDKKKPEAYSPLKEEQFFQFRWVDVYSFFKNKQETNLSKLFIKYLEEKQMSEIPEFDVEDLMAMRKFPSTIKKMDECFEIIKPKFTDYFGAPYIRDYQSLKQVPEHSRYALWRENILSEGYSEILFAFCFEEEDGVVIYAQCYCDSNNKQYDEYKKIIKNNPIKLGSDVFYSDEDYGIVVWFQKNLTDFLSSENQRADITDWFESKMKIWQQFMIDSPSLEWKLNSSDINLKS